MTSQRGSKNLYMDKLHMSVPRPQTPSSSGDEMLQVDGMIFHDMTIPSESGLESTVKLRMKAEADNMSSDFYGNSTTWVNPRGHGLMDRLQHMERRFAQLDAALLEIASLKVEVEDRKAKVKCLTRLSDGYLVIRRRFVELYRKDKMGMTELESSPAIRQGNISAREGDALGDAVLFDKDPSLSPRVYSDLYGLTHQQVLDFSEHVSTDDGGLYRVLNAHATALAQGRIISDRLGFAFQTFLTEVEHNWLQLPNKDPHTPLGRACYAFWQTRGRANSI